MAIEVSNSNPTVLVAEDHDDSRILLKLYFEQLGFLVWAAADGAEALKIAENEALDLILIDAGLPELDGISAATLLRLHWPSDLLPIILMSGFPEDHYRDKASEAGCNAYLTKPVEFSQLHSLLVRLVPRYDKLTRNGH